MNENLLRQCGETGGESSGSGDAGLESKHQRECGKSVGVQGEVSRGIGQLSVPQGDGWDSLRGGAGFAGMKGEVMFRSWSVHSMLQMVRTCAKGEHGDSDC